MTVIAALPELIDTHCHIDVDAFAPDRAQVLRAARAAGVATLVVPAITAAGWPALVESCRAQMTDGPRLYPALGLHPLMIAQHRDTDLAALEQAIGEQAPVAIGEIGLDFHDRTLDPEGQIALFEAQLAIARAAHLPVLLHVRKAHEDVLHLLRRHPGLRGIAHAFNGSPEQAKRYIDLGFCLGFGGMVTYERSHRLRRLAAQLPLESMVLETDAPDMTGAAHHGTRNSPAWLPEVVVALAQVREIESVEVARRTTANARALLRLT